MTRPFFFDDWSVYRRSWGWVLALGIISIILGMIALLDSVLATVASMLVFGWVLMIAGVVEAVHAFRNRNGGHLFLHSLNAVLSFVVGFMLVRYPLSGALIITLLLAVYFVVAGIFRIVTALSLRHPHWGWSLTNGIITLILGILVWIHWPSSGLWIIGLFIGIDLIFSGWAQVMLASGVRHLSAQPAGMGPSVPGYGERMQSRDDLNDQSAPGRA